MLKFKTEQVKVFLNTVHENQQINLHQGSVNDSVVLEGLEQIEVVLKQQLQRRLGNGQRDVLKERVKKQIRF